MNIGVEAGIEVLAAMGAVEVEAAMWPVMPARAFNECEELDCLECRPEEMR